MNRAHQVNATGIYRARARLTGNAISRLILTLLILVPLLYVPSNYPVSGADEIILYPSEVIQIPSL
jgi:hypothetical protein